MTSTSSLEVRRAGWERVLWWLSHPLLLFPIAVGVAIAFGRYEGDEIGHKQTIPLFLQGSTDWGGSNIFAATIALYVVCGILGAIQLSLYLKTLPPEAGLLRRVAAGSLRLAFHWLLFGIGGTITWSYDSWVRPNDFRNLFLLAALLFAGSTVWVAWLSRSRIAPGWRLALAPLWIYVWLVVGSDGNTAKAGQVLNSGVDPIVAPRGLRHGTMLRWHALCDGVFGDIGQGR